MIKFGVDKIANRIKILNYPISYICYNKGIEVLDKPSGDVLFICNMDNSIENIKRQIFNQMNRITSYADGILDEWFEVKSSKGKKFKYQYGTWYK